ncbi:hypothetical protein EDD36DRAFT_418268 [Exophiala viscosa]|uniref:Uncharacterized protein n=1 Tax=Exophiala viscosa TaxID=2486360 RepID=A0AAN6IED7_9EURO|nr:hypothetical protein EDD36DRAFT_418268 [Exophiala viscosa]
MPESRPISYGRGGAGNVTTRDRSPIPGTQTTPTLKTHIYTTGRGGTGNMAKNDNPDEARRAQDVDVPGIILPEGTHHTGRGGGGNLYTPSEEEQRQAREYNEKVRRESFQRDGSKERSGIRALADKAKGKAKENLTSKPIGEDK